jgi:hypothetical protein
LRLSSSALLRLASRSVHRGCSIGGSNAETPLATPPISTPYSSRVESGSPGTLPFSTGLGDGESGLANAVAMGQRVCDAHSFPAVAGTGATGPGGRCTTRISPARYRRRAAA